MRGKEEGGEEERWIESHRHSVHVATASRE